MKALTICLVTSLASAANAAPDAAPAPAQELTLTQRLQLVQQAQDAQTGERLSQPGADPWTVASSASLFARPSFAEGLKLSNDTTTDKKSIYSASVGASLLRPTSPFLGGLQLSGSYNATDRIVGGAVKWNVDLRDARLMSGADILAISSTPHSARCQAIETAKSTGSPEERAQCAHQESHLIEDAYRQRSSWLPSLAVAVATGYNLDSKQRAKSTAAASAELSASLGPTKFVTTLNAEWDQLPPDMSLMSYRSRAGGGVQISDTFQLGAPITLLLGAKAFGCLANSCGNDSSAQIVAGVGLQIQKNAQFGLTVQWGSNGNHLRDALGGLAFSYSFTPPSSLSK
jgi:hypothetical protein